MHKVKVLPHPEAKTTEKSYFYARLLKERQDYGKEVSPVYNRVGLYLDNSGACWEEWAGRAWEYNPEYFKYCLAVLNSQELSSKVIQMLRCIQLFDPKILTKKQTTLLMHYDQGLSVSKVSRESKQRRRKLIIHYANRTGASID